MFKHASRAAGLLLSLSLLAAGAAAQGTGPDEDRQQGALAWLSLGNFRPYIEAGYGKTFVDQKLMTGELPTLGIGEFRFGYREMKPYKSWGYRMDDRFLYGAYGSTDLLFGATGSGEGGHLWRAAVGRKEGFGYQIAFMKLILHHAYTFNLTGPRTSSYAGWSQADSSIIARYDGRTSMGMSTEPGLTAEMFGFLSVSGGYEASIVYPRVVFPEWITSYLLASSSIVLISSFAEDIVAVSPVLGPALYFILRNAVALAWAYAWRSDMHWPFPSETPLMLHSFKVNVGIQF